MEDFIITHRVKSYECDADKMMKHECFQLLCQEIAEEHADTYGCGFDWVMTNRKAWVLLQSEIEWIRRPRWKEEITLRTNTGKATLLQAGRFVEMLDSKGNTLAKCDTFWLIIDFDSRRPIPLKRTGLPIDNPAPPITSSIDEQEWPVSPVSESELNARKSEADFNGHINNCSYLKWVRDTLPDNFAPGKEMNRYSIKFRHESHVGNQMKIEHFRKGNYSRHLITCDNKLRAEIIIKWTSIEN